MKDISRRQFLKVSGSALLGAAFIGISGNYLWKMFTNPGELFFGKGEKAGDANANTDAGNFTSPYKRTFGFVVPDDISAMDVVDGKIFLAAANNIYIYGMNGQLSENFPIPGDIRDIAIHNGNIYALFNNRIEVYDFMGDMVRDWKACSDDSDYCSFTVADGGVFVTDASNKNICKYNIDGSLARFIQSPEGFIVPSYSFGITHIGDTVYCSNPGRHNIEAYNMNGDFIKSFGKAGTEAGAFSGCCNPVQITPTSAGELLTSEKGIPRISCYGTDGTFRSVLLNDKMLGGGHAAYDMRIYKDKLVVAGGNKVQVFQYNSRLAAQTLCGDCTLPCPMKA